MNGLVHPRLRFHIFAKIAVANPKTDIFNQAAEFAAFACSFILYN